MNNKLLLDQLKLFNKLKKNNKLSDIQKNTIKQEINSYLNYIKKNNYKCYNKNELLSFLCYILKKINNYLSSNNYSNNNNNNKSNCNKEIINNKLDNIEEKLKNSPSEILSHNKNLLVKYHNGDEKIIDCIEGPRGLMGESGKTEVIYSLEDPCGYKILNVEDDKKILHMYNDNIKTFNLVSDQVFISGKKNIILNSECVILPNSYKLLNKDQNELLTINFEELVNKINYCCEKINKLDNIIYKN